MEALERKTITATDETERSFDVLASVDMMRHDIQAHGRVLPETRERVYDEELTYIAEGIDRFSHTSFTLQEVDGQLSIFNKGEWRPYIATLYTGFQVAEREAEKDPRRAFLADWAARDLQIGYKLEALEPGQTLQWDSPFPKEKRMQYGDKFLAEVGLQPKREMGFIYLATRNGDGSLTLETHSVDNSDPEAFQAIRAHQKQNSQASIHALREIYDEVLTRKYQKDFFAGRERGNEENAWEFIKRQQALIDGFYMQEIETLARSNASRDVIRQQKKELTYGVWARIRELLDTETLGVASYDYTPHHISVDYSVIRQQVNQALIGAVKRQEVMSGCGGAVTLEKDLLEMTASEAFDSIFGSGSKSKEELSWHGGQIKKGKCVNCHEGPKDVGIKSWCKDCIKGHCG